MNAPVASCTEQCIARASERRRRRGKNVKTYRKHVGVSRNFRLSPQWQSNGTNYRIGLNGNVKDVFNNFSCLIRKELLCIQSDVKLKLFQSDLNFCAF